MNKQSSVVTAKITTKTTLKPTNGDSYTAKHVGNKHSGNNLNLASAQGLLGHLITSFRTWLTSKRSAKALSRSGGYYRRIDRKNVLEASYSATGDGQWHGKLLLNNWPVKETDMDTQEEINQWCLDAFMELHLIGYEEQMTETVARR